MLKNPFGSGLRKVKKYDPIKKLIIRTPPKLIGSIFSFGRINSGKSVSMLSLAGIYHNNVQRNYKIFDLWGGDRNEHLYWTLPSDQKDYWRFVQKNLRLKEEGPLQYKVNLLYPVTKRLPKKLPQNKPYVNSNLFTIPIRNLEPEDFSLIVGNISDKSMGAWKSVLFDSKKKDSALEIIDRYRKLVPKNDTLLNTILIPLSRQNLLKGDYCIYNMTEKRISKELNEKEIISVLCLDFVDREYRMFILGYLLKILANELDRVGGRHFIGLIREASEFFRVTDQTIVADRYKVFKALLSHYIRMGRRGMHCFLDCQSPSETRGLVSGQQDLTVLGRLPSSSDRESATEQMRKDGLITTKQIKSIASLEPGNFVFCPSGKKAYSGYLLLPRCRYWRTNDGNFYKNIWKNEVDKWVSFEQEIDELKEEYKKEENLVKESNAKKMYVEKKEVGDEENNQPQEPKGLENNSQSMEGEEKLEKEPEKKKENTFEDDLMEEIE